MRSTLWKWGTAFYIIAWPLTVAQLLLFLIVVKEEFLCHIGLKHGFGAWRTVTIILTCLLTPLALIIESIYNNIIIKAKHIILPVFVTILYFWMAFIISSLLNETVYGLDLCFLKFENKFDWSD